MYSLDYTHKFKKDLRKCKKRGLDISLVHKAVEYLVAQGSLPASYRPHLLHGNREGQWECHIAPDWLMVWEQNDTELLLLFMETGTHADLFKK